MIVYYYHNYLGVDKHGLIYLGVDMYIYKHGFIYQGVDMYI